MPSKEEVREGIAKPICKLCGQSEELECNISEGGCVELAECLDTITSNLHSQGVVIDRELPGNPFDIDGDWESKEEEAYYVGKSNGFETCKSLIIKARLVAAESLI